MQALCFPGRRLGCGDLGQTGDAATRRIARYPCEFPGHRAPGYRGETGLRRAGPSRAVRRRESRLRKTGHLLQDGLGLLSHHGHPATDRGIRTVGLAGRIGRMDVRQVRRVDVQRRRTPAGAHRGRDTRRHHALLGDRHRGLFRSPLLGEQRQQLQRRVGLRPGRHHRVSWRDLPGATELGRRQLPQAQLFQQGPERRPLRGLGGAGHLHGGAPGRVQIAAHHSSRRRMGATEVENRGHRRAGGARRCRRWCRGPDR
jgi:hypothetical protein